MAREGSGLYTSSLQHPGPPPEVPIQDQDGAPEVPLLPAAAPHPTLRGTDVGEQSIPSILPFLQVLGSGWG